MTFTANYLFNHFGFQDKASVQGIINVKCVKSLFYENYGKAHYKVKLQSKKRLFKLALLHCSMLE